MLKPVATARERGTGKGALSKASPLPERVSRAPLFGLNYKDDPAAARRFLAELGNPFARIGKDATGRAAIDWGVYGVPETYIVDGNGRIALKHVGPLTPQAIAEEILPALKEARLSPGR